MAGCKVGKAIGRGLQVYMTGTIAVKFGPHAAVGVKYGAKYGMKLLKRVGKHHRRTDFRNSTIFSDAIDASFFIN